MDYQNCKFHDPGAEDLVLGRDHIDYMVNAVLLGIYRTKFIVGRGHIGNLAKIHFFLKTFRQKNSIE